MSVYASYRVKCGTCNGGLVPGRPLLAFQNMATQFPTVESARASAVQAGWGRDQVCPPCRAKATGDKKEN